MKTEYSLDVAGQSLRILSEDAPEHIAEVERLLNERIRQLGGGGQNVPLYNAVLLAALNLADDVVKERARRVELREKIRDRSNALLRKLELRSLPVY